MPLYLIPLFLAMVGCSLQKMALRSSTPVLQKSSDGMMEERNWEFFKASAPANIKFLELLWMQDKENEKLHSVVIKSYSGYAFTVPETLFLEDELKGVEVSSHRQDALSFYTRSLDYGIMYLARKGISRDDLLRGDEKRLSERLKDLGEEDITALLYTAQSWGSLINLQKDNVVLVSQVPKVKALFDYVCKLKPEIDFNICDIFYGQYYAGRPKMLGGDPDKGAKIFQDAIKKNPHNLLIRLSYIQHVIVPAMELEKYEEEAGILRREIAAWEDLKRDDLSAHSPYRKKPELNLYNSIAKKRLEILEKYKSSIF